MYTEMVSASICCPSSSLRHSFWYCIRTAYFSRESFRIPQKRAEQAEEGVVTTIRIPTTTEQQVLGKPRSKPGQRNAPGGHAPARPPQNVGACHGGAPIKTHVGQNKYRQPVSPLSFPLQLRGTFVLKPPRQRRLLEARCCDYAVTCRFVRGTFAETCHPKIG